MSHPEGIRKLEAMLAADVTGYSRLMQADDEATVAALEASRAIFRERIQAHRGRVVDMAGDSVLAVFEAVTESVRAGIEIQAALEKRNAALPESRRMKFRIGINLGEVIERPDGTVYGDGVNVAARLEAIGEGGEVTVSGAVFDQVKNRLRVAFHFIGEQHVKNIADPVRAYRVGRETAETSDLVPSVAALPLPDKPSIAVLPFVNMSGDAEQEYFSDGITEDLITSLSKLSGLFVISRSSVFTYKGRSVRPEQISRELGVRYCLEGSVRKVTRQVRISAQLIDATNGYHLWAERYDGELNDIFELQDKVTDKIVKALSPKLSPADPRPVVRPETTSMEAYDLQLRGKALHSKVQQRSAVMFARQMFENAIALDPNYAKAYAALAWTYSDEWVFHWTQDPAVLDRAIDAAEMAVALDDTLAEAHRTLGYLLLLEEQHDTALTELEKAVSLDPNSSWAYAMLALALNFSGRPDEAIGFAKRAMRLDPKCEAWVVHPLGQSYYLLRRYDEAIKTFQEAVARNPDYLPTRALLAVVYAELGRDADAAFQAGEVLRISPRFSVEAVKGRGRAPYRNAADLERRLSGLRKAGLR